MQSRCILGLALLLFVVVYSLDPVNYMSFKGRDQWPEAKCCPWTANGDFETYGIGTGSGRESQTDSMLNCMHQLPNLKMPDCWDCWKSKFLYHEHFLHIYLALLAWWLIWILFWFVHDKCWRLHKWSLKLYIKESLSKLMKRFHHRSWNDVLIFKPLHEHNT